MLKNFSRRTGSALIEYVILVSAILVLAASLTVLTGAVSAEYTETAAEVSSL